MITSTSSSQVKHIVNLQKKSKLRKEEKQFVVEGIKMVSEAPRDRLVKVYVSETFKVDNEEFLKKMNYEALGKDILEDVSDNVFIRMSDTQTPQGIMAVVRKRYAYKQQYNTAIIAYTRESTGSWKSWHNNKNGRGSWCYRCYYEL